MSTIIIKEEAGFYRRPLSLPNPLVFAWRLGEIDEDLGRWK